MRQLTMEDKWRYESTGWDDVELQDALFSLERVVPISITVEEGALSLAEIEALEISIDPAYAEIFEDADN